MIYSKLIHKSIFRINHYKGNFIKRIALYPQILAGLKIGTGSDISNATFTWPHQVAIGKNCVIEKNVFFKYDGVWSQGPSIVIDDYVFVGSNVEFNISKSIYIGKDTLIASGCKFVDHDHGYKTLKKPIRLQPSLQDKIVVEEDVWIGYGVVVLKGVTIGRGVIVAAGSVVTKSIPKNEIWGGIPARKISSR